MLDQVCKSYYELVSSCVLHGKKWVLEVHILLLVKVYSSCICWELTFLLSIWKVAIFFLAIQGFLVLFAHVIVATCLFWSFVRYIPTKSQNWFYFVAKDFPNHLTSFLDINFTCHGEHFMLNDSSVLVLQHSGLYGVNPGDAVCIESGETIAQWQKLYFLKFGVRCSCYTFFFEISCYTVHFNG